MTGARRSARNLGFVCLLLAILGGFGGRVFEVGQPFGAYVFPGLLLLTGLQAQAVGAYATVVLSVLIAIWSVVLIAVGIIAHPTDFTPPSLLFGFLCVTVAVGSWSRTIIPKLRSVAAANA